MKDKAIRLVELEIPGVKREHIVIKKSVKGYSIILRRVKDELYGGYGLAPKFQPPRHPTGEYTFDLFFEDGIWEIDGGQEAVHHENGVLRVRMKQELEDKLFTLDEL